MTDEIVYIIEYYPTGKVEMYHGRTAEDLTHDELTHLMQLVVERLEKLAKVGNTGSTGSGY